MDFVDKLGVFNPSILRYDFTQEYKQVLEVISRIENLPSEMLDFSNYKWAYSIVKSRSFSINLKDLSPKLGLNITDRTQSVMLLPIIDLANHAPRASNSSFNSSSLKLTSHGLDLRSDRVFQAGEEFVFQYSSKLANKPLLKSYGFTIQRNPLDYFIVKLNDVC